MKKWKKLAITGLALVTMTALLAGCGSDKAATNKDSNKNVIKFGAEMTYPPFEYADGDQYKGFDIDLGNAIAEELGMKAEFSSLGFDALIPALQSNQIDAILSGMVITEDRAKEINFSDPYYNVQITMVVKKDNNTIKTPADLKGVKVGAQIGTTGAMFANEKGAETVDYDAVNVMLQALQQGNIKAVILDEPVAQYYINNANMNDLKLVTIPDQEKSELGIGVNKDNPELLKKINDALAKLKANGKYDELKAKWFGAKK